jgi:hypothetical protein
MSSDEPFNLIYEVKENHTSWLKPWEIRLFPVFLLWKLPLAWLAGLRITYLDSRGCEIRMRHSFWNKNPFGSMYFAAMAMGAEMSTGLPAYTHLRRRRQSVSLLLSGMEAVYHKKAVGLIHFRFEGMKSLLDSLETLQKSGDTCTALLVSQCFNKQKQLMAEFRFTWTFRQR